MKNAKLFIILQITFTFFLETGSSIFNVKPERFIRERSQCSRNRTIGAFTDSVLDNTKILDFVALANQRGYPAEEHLVTTPDGYQLLIHRIPGSLLQPKAKWKRVVFLQHGLFASSDTWVLMGPSRDLSYMLADAGYDVWLGNARGNTYSRSHIKLSPNNDEEFWKFSFHEIAVFDMTASIDYILLETDQHSIVYIGHSMGTTISYILLSTIPEYNDKIKLVISLSPTGLWHVPSRANRLVFDNLKLIIDALTRSKINEVLPLTELNAQLVKVLCSDESDIQQFCINFYFSVAGYNPKQFNSTLLPYIFSYFPAGASLQTVNHYVQNILSGDFKMFDYGTTVNLLKYKQNQPPLYNLKNIVTPVALFYGKGDILIPPENSIDLAKELPNVVTIEAVPDEMFNHGDFLYARDLKTLLNNRILEIIKKFEQ